MAERQETATGGKGAAAAAEARSDRARQRARQPATVKKARVGPRKFVREAWTELKKVDWPNRRQVGVYTVVVLISVVTMTLLVFGMDLVFAKGIFEFFR